MTLLLPRLDRDVARAMIARHERSTLTEIANALPDHEPVVTYSPVGGSRITDQELSTLRRDVLALAVKHGMPEQPTRLSKFEGRCARLLYERLPMTPHEASHEEVWSYLTCCWLLDVAFWRFGADADERRFIGNVNRNTFRRMWWRAEVLGPEVDLDRLGEDELVNIMERPTIAGDRTLARLVAQEFLVRVERDEAPERMLLMREAMKRLLRLTPFVAFSGLSRTELEEVVTSSFDAAAASLEGRSVASTMPAATGVPEASPVVTQVISMPIAPPSGNGMPVAGSNRLEDLDRIGQVALDIARRTGRVTNLTLRDVVAISPDEAREVLRSLVNGGKLLRQGVKRGTHYVVPGSAATPDPPRPNLESALSWLLRRDRKNDG